MKQAIFGYGGHAKEVAMQMGGKVTFFVDDEYSNNVAKPISEFNVLEYDKLLHQIQLMLKSQNDH